MQGRWRVRLFLGVSVYWSLKGFPFANGGIGRAHLKNETFEKRRDENIAQ